MKKYMFVEFNRFDIMCSEVKVFEGESLEEVVKKILGEVYELSEEVSEKEMNSCWNKKGNMMGSDGDEFSYMVVEIE